MRNPSDYVSQRAHAVDASGIRKVFDLEAKMKDPINLSIGLPDFDVPDVAKDAAIDDGAAKGREALVEPGDAKCRGAHVDAAASAATWRRVRPSAISPP